MTGKITNTTFTPQEYLLNGCRAFSVWAVIENWAVSEEGGHNELLYRRAFSMFVCSFPEKGEQMNTSGRNLALRSSASMFVSAS